MDILTTNSILTALVLVRLTRWFAPFVGDGAAPLCTDMTWADAVAHIAQAAQAQGTALDIESAYAYAADAVSQAHTGPVTGY